MDVRPREGRRRGGGAGGRWRGPVQRPDAAVPTRLVARGRGRRGCDRGRVRVARPGGGRPAVQPVRGPAAGPYAGGGHPARGAGRRRRGRRARGGRLAAHHGRECVRQRARAHEAGGPVRHAARAVRSRAGRPGRGARAWPRQAPRRRARHAVGGDRRGAGDVRGDAAHAALGRAGRRATGRARVHARARARPGRGLVRPHRRLEPALAGGREPGRRLLARAHRRAARVHRAGAPARAGERGGPRSPRGVPVPVRDPSLDGGPDRHRAGVRAPPRSGR